MEDKEIRSIVSYKVKKQRVDEEAKLSNFMHRFLKKSTDHEKQGLLSVIQDDRNVPIAIDTAVTGSHHDDTTSEPLIQPTVGWRTAAPLAKYKQRVKIVSGDANRCCMC